MCEKGCETVVKRIIALLLSAFFVLCASGCGEDDVNDLLGASVPDYSTEESAGDIENATLISEMTATVTALCRILRDKLLRQIVIKV